MEKEPLSVVDEQAQFPGGKAAMMSFLAQNIVYPQSALEAGLSGKCFLKLTVLKDGSISDVKVLRGVPYCPECDREAIRVIEIMPDWTPAKVKGQAVDSYYNLPIVFYMQ